MAGSPRLSVLLATHARAASLARTLDTLVPAAREAPPFEVVVVENGPPDGSEAVVRARKDRLPLRYLHHPEAGKSAALNRVLDAGGLGPAVAFLDDDVAVAPDWLRVVGEALERWPEVQVFGGRVALDWPQGEIPAWAGADPWVRAFAFGEHRPREDPGPYPPGLLPYGPNWWCRRTLFDEGRRFDPRYGPRAGRWISGEETRFLWDANADGHAPLHVPAAVVKHRVAPERLRPAWLVGRAWREGRSRGTLERVPRAAFRRRHRLLWQVEQAGRAARALARFLHAHVNLARPWSDAAVVARARAARRLGAEVSRLALAPDAPALRETP